MNIPDAPSTEACTNTINRCATSVVCGGRRTVWAALLITVALASGCATSQQTAFEQANLAPALTRPDGSVRVDTESQEAAKLWASAERAMSEGRLSIALELLYEALDVDPQNSLLWSRAAELQLDVVEPELAETYATRSNSLANQNRPLLFRNWLIIEHARGMRGDLLGVRSAHKQVQIYQSR